VQIRNYYHNNFKDDLLKFLPDTNVPYFGHIWHHDCGNLIDVNPQSRAAFLICLYFTILVDQAMYTHFNSDYPRFAKLTRYPKFCHGLAQFHKNPREILYIPFKKGLVNQEDLEPILQEGMELFIDETADFFQRYMPQIKAEKFFKKLIYDPDVQIPLIFIIADENLKDDIVFKTYKALKTKVQNISSDLR